MAYGFSQLILVGNITKDPEVATTTSGKTVCNFTLALDENKDTTLFVNCTAWERTAELLQKYVSKGDRLLLNGKLTSNSWEKDGKTHTRLEMNVLDLRMLSTKGENRPLKQSEVLEQTRDNAPEDIDDGPIDLSEIPF